MAKKKQTDQEPTFEIVVTEGGPVIHKQDGWNGRSARPLCGAPNDDSQVLNTWAIVTCFECKIKGHRAVRRDETETENSV